MSDHVILEAERHRELRIRTERASEFGDDVMCCITFPSEFRQVQDEYPILFRRSAERDDFSALAMCGFENGENLFIDQGRWDARYLPLAMDVQPFLIGMPAPGADTKQVHIDMASPRIGNGEGVRLFDDQGLPTPYLESIAEKLGLLDDGYQASGAFLHALRRHELLEPMSLEVRLDDGSSHRLVGFHVIDEDRLRALDPDALGELHAAGHLMPIFMAMASLSKLGSLIGRKNKRLAYG